MNKTKPLALALITASGLTLTSCMDEKFDLSSIDSTIGVNINDVTLPGDNDTETMCLDDFLDLGDSDFISIADNGDYLISKTGDDIKPTTVTVDAVTIEEKELINHDIAVTLPESVSEIKEPIVLDTPVKVSSRMSDFTFESTYPDDIVSIESAEISSNITMNVAFTKALKAFVPTIDKIQLTLPTFINAELVSSSSKGSYDAKTGVLTFNDVPTNQELNVQLDIKELRNFVTSATENGSYILMNDGNITMVGGVDVDLALSKVTPANGADITTCGLTCKSTLSAINLTTVKGCFDPEIDLDDLGEIEINDVPDFLSDPDVCADLYNPVFTLTATNSMDVAVTANGTLTARDAQGKALNSVHIEGIKINPSQTSNIVISRRPVDTAGDTQTIIAEDLSTLVETIPHTITFEADAKADRDRVSTIRLGYDYIIQPAYTFEAPLAFGEKAQIVYTDLSDGMAEDLEDISISDGSTLTISAIVDNKIPAFIELDVTPLDKSGAEISASDLSVNIDYGTDGAIIADGGTQAGHETKLTITATQHANDALHRLDALRYTVKVKASHAGVSVTGVNLNSKNQTLKMRDIKVNLNGKVIIEDK